MSGTVSHVPHLLFGGRCGISSAVWMVYLYLWLPILCSSGDFYFSALTIHRESGLLGIACQIQVLTQYSFLAVWKTVFFPGRGLAKPRLFAPSPRHPKGMRRDFCTVPLLLCLTFPWVSR